jgi:hypothetical protein
MKRRHLSSRLRMSAKRQKLDKQLSAHGILGASRKTAVRLIASIKATGGQSDLAENHNAYLYGKPTN